MNYLLSFLIALLPLFSLAQHSHSNTAYNIPTPGVNLQAPSNCPASPYATDIVQPDGTTITIYGKGNMLNSWTETTDGYTIIPVNGIYQYAQKINGNLSPTGVKANNPGQRPIAEINYLAGISKSIKPDFDPLKSSVLNQVNAQLSNKTYPTTGNIRILAILIDYPDLQSTFAKSSFDSLLYASNYRNGDGSFKTYYETSSNGQLSITVDVMGWYRAANNFIYYSRDSGYSRAAELARESVLAADAAGANFANYDNDNDGDVDGILTVHAGPGAEQGSRTQYIWSHRWVISGSGLGALNLDGKFINDYMMNPETRISGLNQNLVGIGVFVHEFGHNLGLPDLYDTDPSNGDSEGIGNWCLMAGGGWLGGEHRPINLSAWCRIENNWDTPTIKTIGSSSQDTLRPSHSLQNEIFQVNTGVSTEYFLLENRQKQGLDLELPGTGLAIWHINTVKTNASGNSVNADENLKGVDLEEADGNNDLDNEVNRGDAGDLYPGSSNNTTFDDNSNPNARNYNLNNTGLQLRNIGETGSLVHFDFGPAISCSGTTNFTATTGNISDGSGASNYSNNANCSWYIQPNNGPITLTFSAFDTESNTDILRIYEGNSSAGTATASYSGNSIPGPYTSTGNELFLEFTSNGSVSGQGFDLSYSTSSTSATCLGNTTLNAATGTFTDGSGTNVNYSDNLQCSWTIDVGNAIVLSLHVDSLDLSSGDTLSFYDGTSNTGTLLEEFVAGDALLGFYSNSNQVFVEFKTDATNNAKGWQVSYDSISYCSGLKTLTAGIGTFTDGSGPAPNQLYQSNSNCQWLIQPTGATFVELSFNRFDTEANFDFVSVYDGSTTGSPLLGRFSGTNIPGPFISSGNSLLVEFTSDISISRPGFEATYFSYYDQCIPNRTLSNPSGTFNDGSGSGNYDNNLTCGWLIQPSLATNITLTFSAFDTESNLDVVRVYDGVDNTGTLVATFSGNTLPSATSINGTNKSMYVEFVTNGTNTAQGWTASYTSTASVTCAGQTVLSASSGTVTDGSGSLVYDNNLSCTWLIQPASAATITFDMNSINLANIGDRVRVYDGSTTTSPILGTFFFNNLGSTLTAFSGSMLIEFITDGSGQAQGWSGTYNTSSTFCSTGNLFTANFGSFTDGSTPFGTNYANNSDCSWLIQPSASNVAVRLSLFQFNTEAGNDTLTIYDGANASAPILATLSGNLGSVPAITSSGGTMFLTFKTNGSNTFDGWRATYGTQTIPFCSGTTTLTAASGTFNDGSPAASNYIENSNCKWLIQPTGATIIALNFNRFNTQATLDYVKVYDGSTINDPLIGTYSGTSLPPNIISSGGSLLVEFVSNNFQNFTGWEASYISSTGQCFPTVNLTNFTDTIRDGSGSGNYQNNLNCTWSISPSTATSVTLNFLTFDLTNPGDTLKIYDGTSSAANLLAAYTGSNLPASVTSTGGDMFIEFNTDGANTAQGWEAYYTITSSLSCFGTTVLTAPSGSFDDGSGTSNYDNNLNCGWRISPPGNPAVIELVMTSVNMANFGDFVRVYDGVDNTGTFLGTFFGNNTGNPVRAFSGDMFVEFTTDNFSQGQGFDATYNSSSTYCVTQTTLTGNFGSFTDGSPNGTNYLNNTDCSWLIQPTAPNVAVRLILFQFDTELTNDTVTIYDGASTSDPILGTFSGNLGTLNPIVSTGGSMLVTFKTNGSTTASGWRASYGTQQIPFCGNTTTLTASSGTFTDGSPNGTNYVENSDCKWLIQPPNAIAIDLSFNYFAMQANFDSLIVYNGATVNDPIIGAFTGTNLPTNVLGSAPSMLVQFKSNANTNQNGFSASYTSSTSVQLTGSPDTVVINAGLGSTGAYTVASNTSWQTSDNANWLIVSPFNGTGNQSGSVLATQPNIGPERYAEVYFTASNGITRDTIIVAQRASGNFLNIVQDTLFFSDAAGSQIANILSSVSWNLSPSMAWISTSPSSGSNNANPNISVSQNTGAQDRIGMVVASGNLGVANDTLYIKQSAPAVQPPSLSVNPSSLNLNASTGSSDQFTVNSTVTWQTSTPASWLTITNPPNTVDTNTVLVTANSTNLSINSRSSFVAVQDVGATLFDTVFITQAGSNPILDLNPDTVYITSANASTGSATILSNISWSGSISGSFFTASPLSGSGQTNGSISISSTSANTNINPRIGYIAFEDLNQTLQDTVYVVQAGATVIPPHLNVNPKNLVLAQPASSLDSFKVNSNVNWAAISPASWLSIVVPANPSDTGKVEVITNSDNNTGSPRSTYVAVQDQSGQLRDTVYIDQLSSTPSIIANPDTIFLAGSSGSSGNGSIGSNISWATSASVAWFSGSVASGTGNANFTITANSDNLSASRRTAYFLVSSTGASIITDTVWVVQDRLITGPPTSSPDTIRIAAASGSSNTYIITAPTNSSWTTVPNDVWLSLSPGAGTGSATITATAVSANTSTAERISFAVTAETSLPIPDTIWIIQEGVPSNLTASPSAISLSFSQGSSDNIQVSSNVSWTVTNPASWLSINPTSGNGNTTVSVTSNSDNLTGSNRVANLSFDAAGVNSAIVSVTQVDGLTPNFSLSVDTVFVNNPQGSTGQFNVLSNASSWTLSENTPWLLINPSSGSNTSNITVLAASKNNFGNTRSALVKASSPGFPDDSVWVVQAAANPLFQVAPNTIILGGDSADEVQFNISSNLVEWIITENSPWMDVKTSVGSFTQRVTVVAIDSNNTGNVRKDSLMISSPPQVPQYVEVIQDTVMIIGINKLATKKLDWSIYPNPNEGVFQIDLAEELNIKENQLSVLDVMGKKCGYQLIRVSQSQYRVEINNASAGLYFINLVHNGKRYSSKITVLDR